MAFSSHEASVQLNQELSMCESEQAPYLGQTAAACSPSPPCSRSPCRCPLCSTLLEREREKEEFYQPRVGFMCLIWGFFTATDQSSPQIYHYCAGYRCTPKGWEKTVELTQASLMASPRVLLHLNTLLALFIKPIKNSCRPAQSPLVLCDKPRLLQCHALFKRLEGLQTPCAPCLTSNAPLRRMFTEDLQHFVWHLTVALCDLKWQQTTSCFFIILK